MPRSEQSHFNRQPGATSALMVALVLCLLALTGASADEPKLFPQEQITAEQWETLHTRVKTAPGARDESRPEQPDVEAIVVPDEHTIYYFTTGGPAHPALVVFRAVQQNGKYAAMRIESYFSGSRDEYQKWFASFLISQLGPQILRKPAQ